MNFLYSNVEFLKDSLFYSFKGGQFFYFTNFPFNSVSFLFFSFCFFICLVAFKYRRDFVRHNQVTVVYLATIELFLFVYKVVVDYLAKLNGVQIAYVHHFFPFFLGYLF